MQFTAHRDDSAVSATRSRSRGAGHFILSSEHEEHSQPTSNTHSLDGPIHTLCKIIDVVVGSAAEAEIGAGYLNGQAVVPIAVTLAEMGHPQGPTPMQVDNTTSEGFANGTMKQKRSKAMDMRWYWLQDRVRQKQFLVYFCPGKDNLADPFTKHHTPAHIKQVKPKFLLTTEQLAYKVIHHLVRGCVNSGSVRPPTVRPHAPNPHTQAGFTANNKIVIAPRKWNNRLAH